jgi:hypothetical protein
VANTNLAAEFHVLSVLHRLGLQATLTLGNTKAVDLVIARTTGDVVTIDVKGLAGKTGWPIDNLGPPKSNHFIVFVCYLGKIDDPASHPEVYVVPSTRLKPLIYNAPGGRRLLRLGTARTEGGEFRDAWRLLQRLAA